MPSAEPGPRDSAASGRPGVRAKVLQQWLSFPERFDPGLGQQIRRSLPEATRQTIADAAPLAWLPMELDIEVVDAIAKVMGPKRFSAMARSFFVELMPQPPLGALLELGTKLMGLSPESFLKWWSKGWEAVYRNCGAVTTHSTTDGRGRITFKDMPLFCIQSDAFVEAVVCTAYGVYTLTGTTGVVRIGALSIDKGFLELELEWRLKRASLPRPSLPRRW